MKIFDANAWIGRWPFALCAAHDARSLAAELATHGIARALTSSLHAVLAPEPGPANRELLHETCAVTALEPVPVINPALPGWMRELDAMTVDSRVRAVRVLPSYHRFEVAGRAMAALAAELVRRRLGLIVQVRLIDERHEFHAMRLKAVSWKRVAELVEENPRLPVIAAGLLRSEINEIAPRCPALRCDLSFAEWLNPVPELMRAAKPTQLVFGSNTPILMPGAQVEKLAGARGRARTLVAHGNLEAFVSARASRI